MEYKGEYKIAHLSGEVDRWIRHGLVTSNPNWVDTTHSPKIALLVVPSPNPKPSC
jgi:hypothetical protein